MVWFTRPVPCLPVLILITFPFRCSLNAWHFHRCVILNICKCYHLDLFRAVYLAHSQSVHFSFPFYVSLNILSQDEPSHAVKASLCVRVLPFNYFNFSWRKRETIKERYSAFYVIKRPNQRLKPEGKNMKASGRKTFFLIVADVCSE